MRLIYDSIELTYYTCNISPEASGGGDHTQSMDEFLRQDSSECVDYEQTIKLLEQISK